MDTQTDTPVVYTIPQWTYPYFPTSHTNCTTYKNMKRHKPKTTDVIETNLHIAHMFLETPIAVPLADEIVLQDLAQNCTYMTRTAVHPLLLAFFVEGFSEVRIEKQTLLADEKSAIVEFIFYGHHKSVFLSIPATGKRVIVPMVLVCQIADGYIHHIRWYYDAGTLLRQLGLAL